VTGTEEKCIMSSFIICAAHQTILGQSKHRLVRTGHGRDEKCLQSSNEHLKGETACNMY